MTDDEKLETIPRAAPRLALDRQTLWRQYKRHPDAFVTVATGQRPIVRVPESTIRRVLQGETIEQIAASRAASRRPHQ